MHGGLILFVVLFIVIFVHELGHVIAFRRASVDVETMSIGLPWGPHLKIKNNFLRKYFGQNFTLILSPLIIAGYVKPSNQKFEETLPDRDKAFIYGGGVIANILLYISMYAVSVLIVIMSGDGRDVYVLMFSFLGKHNPFVALIAAMVLLSLLLYYARFIALSIFPIVGILMLGVLTYLIWVAFSNTTLLANGGFVELSAITQKAKDAGQLLNYVGFISLIVGLGNLMPLYPLDGGHIGKIFVQRIVPGFEPYYRRLGIVIVLFLFILQFTPDLYLLFK